MLFGAAHTSPHSHCDVMGVFRWGEEKRRCTDALPDFIFSLFMVFTTVAAVLLGDGVAVMVVMLRVVV